MGDCFICGGQHEVEDCPRETATGRTPVPIQTWQEKRLLRLSINYHNELLYVVKLRDALESILCESSKGVHAKMQRCKEIAEEALAAKNAPPPPFKVVQSNKLHTGHPLPEYLHLPMRPTDDYHDPDK
jgi:hypothetical protein